MAKKIALALLVVLLLLVLGLGWAWHRITALPDWYGSSEMLSEEGAPQVDRDWVAIPDQETQYQLRNPHLRSETARKAPVGKAIKASRATMKVEEQGTELDAGAVINLSEADLDAMSPREQADFQKAIDAFPALTGRDVYVGIEGEVIEKQGELKLGKDTKLRVGDTSYSLASAAKRLGMSEAELRAAIEKELHRLDLQPPPA